MSTSKLGAPTGTNRSVNLRCTFEPQVFRKNRCKKCLRDKSDHEEPKIASDAGNGDVAKADSSSVISTDKPEASSSSLNSVPNKSQNVPARKSSSSGSLIDQPAAVNEATGETKKNPSGSLEASSSKPTSDKPPPSSSLKVRPVIKAMDSRDSENSLNTTTQTIILSKSSPQIRRASSSASASADPSGNRGKYSSSSSPVRRFSTTDERREDEEERPMRTPLSGSLMSMATAVESASDLQSMHTAISGSGSTMSLNSVGTFISSREQFQETIDEMQNTVNSLSEQLDEKRIQVRELEDLISDLRDQLNSGSSSSDIGTIKRKGDPYSNVKLREMEKENLELINLRKLLELQLEQIRECMDEVNDPEDAKQPLIERVRDVTHKLQSAEMMCEDLMDESEELKKELRSLEAEMDELHDNFRQDQAMEFQAIQKDLEQTMKNCRILQFKLRKSERRCEELEEDRARYEIKVRQLTSIAPTGTVENIQFRELENELRELTDVNRRMQEQIEHLEEEKNALRSAFDAMNKSCLELEKQKEGYRMQAEKVKSETSVGASQEYDINQLLRDLCDSVERETDLRDQLKFAEDEAKRLRKHLADMEHENDSLHHQLKKISSARHSGDFSKATDPMKLSAEEVKMQLEVAEHEIASLKRRFNDAEQDNENLKDDLKKMKAAYEELKAAKEKVEKILEQPESTGPGKPRSYYEQKIKLLESETNDLRKKLVDKERQLERITADIEVMKKKGSMQRSKSVEDYQIVDLKRQLQMAEQEIILLRQKVQALEADNDKLSVENKRLQFRSQSSKRGSTDELENSRSPRANDEASAKAAEELEKHRPDINALNAAGKSAKDLISECGSLNHRLENLEKVIVAAREQFERCSKKSNIRTDIATRQELKTRIEELETELQSAFMVAEQERSTARNLQLELDGKPRGPVELPLTDEAKEYRMKLNLAEQQIHELQHELEEVQGLLEEERRKSRSNENELLAKERMDTELRNLKQELNRQRNLVEELQGREGVLSKQATEWQKKYNSLKDTYKSDTDAWQRELSELENELQREKAHYTAAVEESEYVKQELERAKSKAIEYEQKISSLTEAAKKKEKEFSDKLLRLEKDFAEESKQLNDLKEKYEHQDELLAQEDAKVRQEKTKLESKVASLSKELDFAKTSHNKELSELKEEVSSLQKVKTDQEKTIQELRNKIENEKSEVPAKAALDKFGTRGLAAAERARAADQIKEEVEKLHKQLFEMQKQLMDAKRAGDDAQNELARNERRWLGEKEELNRKLRQDEKIHKAEISAVTMRFENKQKLLEDETKTLNSTVKQLKIERDGLQERFDNVWKELTKLRSEHSDTAAKLESTTTQLSNFKSVREDLNKQNEELQSKFTRLEQERNEAKTKLAKDKSSYELKISELQNKLSQYEGQHAKMSAYALRTRQMMSPVPGRSRNGDTLDVLSRDEKEKLEATEKALKKSDKDISDLKNEINALKLDKERESDLLRAKIKELQEKQKPLMDAQEEVKMAYDSIRTEYEVIKSERDDLIERLAENESSQIKERGKIDQILAEIQRLKEVAPLFSSEEDLAMPSAPKRQSRMKERTPLLEEKSSSLLGVKEKTKYKGKKSTDLQKAIENIEKVSEDIKAERRNRRTIKPHKRSHSASIAESAASGPTAHIRRFPSVDADDSDEASVTLPAPTPLSSIAKIQFPLRNPRFPSIPPSFIISPPSALRENRSRSYENHHFGSAITEECFSNPGGSWDSIDSETSFDTYSLTAPRPLPKKQEERFVSMPNLPEKVDSATSTDDRPKRSIFETAQEKRKKIMSKMRPHSLHSSTESIQEKVEKNKIPNSQSFLEKLAAGITGQNSRTSSPIPKSSSVTESIASSIPHTPSVSGSFVSSMTNATDKPEKAVSVEKPEKPTSSKDAGSVIGKPVEPAKSVVQTVESTVAPPRKTSLNPLKAAIPEPKLEGKDVLKNAMRSLSPISKTKPGPSKAPADTGKDASGSGKEGEKERRGSDEKKKPLVNTGTWRKPISDLAKKFEKR